MTHNFLILMKVKRMTNLLIMPLWKGKAFKVMNLNMVLLVRVRVHTMKTLKKVMKMTVMVTF